MYNTTMLFSVEQNTSTPAPGLPIEVLHFHIFIEYLPVVVFTASLCVVGIVGNILTVVFYKPKLLRSSTPFLIVSLAVVDIIVCLLGIASVLDMCVNILFSDRILCKAVYFLDQWMIYISVLILWIIAIDRYIKLCRPFGFQFTMSRAKHGIVGIVIFSFVVSIRDIVTYDVIDIRIENLINVTEPVIGHYCTTSLDKDLKDLIFYSHIFDMSVIIIVLITFAFTYSRIGYKLLKHKQSVQRSSERPLNVEQDDSSVNSDTHKHTLDSISNCSSVPSSPGRTRKLGTTLAPPPTHIIGGIAEPRNSSLIKAGVTRFCNNTDDILHKTCNNNNNTKGASPVVNKISVQSTVSVNAFTKSVTQMKQSERNVTCMMFAVSLGLVVCFTPYFLVSVTARVHDPGKIEIEPLVQLAVRSPFWNSVINPILFSVFNPKYRKYVKKFFCKCC